MRTMDQQVLTHPSAGPKELWISSGLPATYTSWVAWHSPTVKDPYHHQHDLAWWARFCVDTRRARPREEEDSSESELAGLKHPMLDDQTPFVLTTRTERSWCAVLQLPIWSCIIPWCVIRLRHLDPESTNNCWSLVLHARRALALSSPMTCVPT